MKSLVGFLVAVFCHALADAATDSIEQSFGALESRLSKNGGSQNHWLKFLFENIVGFGSLLCALYKLCRLLPLVRSELCRCA